MTYKIYTLKQLEEIADHIPIYIYNVIHNIVAMLDYEYGENRNVDEADGGFVVYADSQNEIDEAVKAMHLNKKIPELVDVIAGYTNTLYLKNNEYGINFIAPRELANE